MPIEIFVSYSHLDEQEKNELLLHLNVLHHEGRFDLWSDDRIGVGDVWKTQIEEALIRARIAILLVTKNFLNSDFILEQEVPEILKRQAEGLTIIPVIARECAWRGVEWLARLQVFSDGEPIWRKGGKHVDKELSELAYLVADIANKEQPARLVAGMQPATNAPPSNATAAEPAYEHVLYISSAPDDNQRSSSPSSQVYTTVEEELRARGSDDAPLAGHKREDGFIVSASGDPAPLLRFAMRLTEMSGPAGGSRMRMGLHSIAADDAPPNRQTGLRDRAVFVARRVMELGRAGHLLVSQASAELLRKDAEFASVFHLGRAVIEPPENVEVYNVYRRGGPAGGPPDFGNERTPHAAVPETVVKEFRPPTELRALKEERFKVTFRPGLAYVKLKFEFEDADGNPAAGVRIDCYKHWEQGCSFEYRFADPEQEHQPKFKLMAEDPPADQTLFIKMSCFNEYDEPLTVPLRRRVRLLRKAPFPSGASNVFQILPWARDQFMRWPVPFRVLFLVVAIPVLALLGKLWLCNAYPQFCDGIRCRAENLKRSYWYGYEPYLSPPWHDEVRLDQPLTTHWQFSDDQLCRVKGEAVADANDGALLVKSGSEMALNADLSGKAFYDFKVKFKVRIVKGEKAVWVFRANREKQTGYVFELWESEAHSNLVLNGWRQTGAGRRVPFDKSGPREILIGADCVPIPASTPSPTPGPGSPAPTGTSCAPPPPGTSCYDYDSFEILAEVKGNTINYQVTLVNEYRRPAVKIGPHQLNAFTDEDGLYPYGANGFLMPPDGQMLVQFWRLDPISSACDVR